MTYTRDTHLLVRALEVKQDPQDLSLDLVLQ
jgi:hypothetical protein